MDERALARPVTPHDPEELARVHVEGDVVERMQEVRVAMGERVGDPLAQRVHAVVGDRELLGDALDIDHGRPGGQPLSRAATRQSLLLLGREFHVPARSHITASTNRSFPE